MYIVDGLLVHVKDMKIGPGSWPLTIDHIFARGPYPILPTGLLSNKSAH